jgi:ribonuclease HI
MTAVAEMDADLDEVVRREKQLLDPACRADRSCVESLLHPDFVEHGGSGRVWTRGAVLQDLPANPWLEREGVDFYPVRLAPDVVLLTYRIVGARPSLRSSVWLRDADGRWRMRFHQGTLSA